MTVNILQELRPAEPSDLAEEYFIVTRDGVKLATDVYVPGKDTTRKYSAVLSRTPYDKCSRSASLKDEAEYFMSRDYVYLAQDVRGKFRCDGATEPYAHDVSDAYDTVAWIVEQSWSDGTVGAVGASYAGFTTWATIACGHPAVKAAAPAVTGIDTASPRVASQWQSWPASMLSLQDLPQFWTNNSSYLMEIDYTLPLKSIIEASTKTVGPSIGVQHLLERSKHQGWYNAYGDRHPYHTTRIPVLHCQCWYDPGLGPLAFRDWRHFQSSPQRNLHYLRVGSTDHSGYNLEDASVGSSMNLSLDINAIRAKISSEMGDVADFFDEHVKGRPSFTSRPRARWHIGHVGWRESASFPPLSTPYVLKLVASPSPGVRHLLQPKADLQSSVLHWTHDPKDPVPSTSTVEGIWSLLAEYPDERDLESRRDVLTFRTASLLTDIVFAGQPTLRLQLSISSESAHLFATLQDVYPDETVRPISWARTVVTKAHHRHMIWNMDDNAYCLKKGHMIQLQLSASNWPLFLAYPGTDDNPWFSPRPQPVEFELTVGGTEGAELVLPQIEA